MQINFLFVSKTIITISLSLYTSKKVYSQECNCEVNLKTTITKISDSYAGFNDKVKSKVHYKKLTDSLLNKSKSISNFFDCYNLLYTYSKFFKDPHLRVSLGYDSSFNSSFTKTFRFKNNSNIDIDSLYEKMKIRGMDSIEGIWTDYSETRKILIAKNKRPGYTGYIYKGDSLYWYKGQIRFEILVKPYISEAVYYRNDRNKKNLNVYFRPNLIYIQGYEYLTKDGTGAFADESTTFRLTENKKVGIFKIPDLSGWNWPIIDSLIKVNTGNINNCNLLIIDFRDNGGGGYDALRKLYPYIFTRHVPNYKYWIKSSDDNINDFRNLLAEGTYMDSSLKKMISDRITLLEKNKGKLCEINNENYFKNNVFNSTPQKVIFLINEETSSAAEMFVKIARENSTKVKVYGKNSYGVMDYGHVALFNLDCSLFTLLVPKSRSAWVDKIRYDYKGISPDVRIPIEVDDWITFVLKKEILK